MATAAPTPPDHDLFDLPDDYLGSPLVASSSIVRVHHKDHAPIFFGPMPGEPPKNRFDAPGGQFRTMYAAKALAGGFVETMLRRGTRVVAQSFIDQRCWSVLYLKVDCNLALLHGEGLLYHGVMNDVCAGDDYTRPQMLALALFEAFQVQGLVYRARHNNDEICYAINSLFDAENLECSETRCFADFPEIVDELLCKHGAVRDPEIPLPPIEALP